MRSSTVHPSSWNRGGLGLAVAAAFILQAGLLWIVGARSSSPIVASAPGFIWRLAPPELSQQALPDWLWAGEPTLFALATPNGFSGGAWMNHPTRDYELPGFDEPPRWLAFNPDRLGPILERLAPPDVLGAKTPDQRGGRLEATEIRLPPVLISTKSVLHADDNLRSRLVDSLPDLPSWPTNDLIQSSVVQIALDGTGSVMSAGLLRVNESISSVAATRSRAVEADRLALKIANSLRFKPVNSGPDAVGWIWGKLTFDWASEVAAPAGTNAVSKIGP